jgi:hypothetical protein
MRPLWIGGLIAPLAAPVAFDLALLLLSVAKDGWMLGTHDWAAGVLAALVFVLPVSYLTTWLLGMPYIYWLQRKSRLSWLHVCMGAVCSGVISMLVFQTIAKSGPLTMATLTIGALLGAVLAVCVALAFCWLVRVPMSAETK